MKWLALRVGGQRVAVHIVRPSHPALEGCEGTYIPNKNRIYISSELEKTAREDALFHELDHAVNFVSGAENLIMATLKTRRGRRLSWRALADLEEQLVRCRTPIWHRLLKDLGFAFPKGPTE